MTLTKGDLAILDKFEFGVPPVGVRVLVKRPGGVPRLNKNLALCGSASFHTAGTEGYAMGTSCV